MIDFELNEVDKLLAEMEGTLNRLKEINTTPKKTTLLAKALRQIDDLEDKVYVLEDKLLHHHYPLTIEQPSNPMIHDVTNLKLTAFEVYADSLGGFDSDKWHDASLDVIFNAGYLAGQKARNDELTQCPHERVG